MIDLNPTVLLVTLSSNCLKCHMKDRDRQSHKMERADFILFIKITLNIKTCRLKIRG